jgi:hypothetical protein
VVHFGKLDLDFIISSFFFLFFLSLNICFQDHLLGKSEESKAETWDAVLHSLDSSLHKYPLELHQYLKVEVEVRLVVNQMDQLGHILLSLLEFIGLLWLAVFVVLEKRQNEVYQLLNYLL